jgi:addiction module HigA family antidote
MNAIDGMPPIHPGEILRDELLALDLSASRFAKALAVPANRVTGILNGTRAITADTALRLSRYFGTSAEFWMNLQQDYELKRARAEAGAAIERSVHPRAA